MYTEKILGSENKHGPKTRKSQLKPLISVIVGSESAATMRKWAAMPALVSRCFKEGFRANIKIPED